MERASGYQPHIDGLRAVAILPVLLFHAHIPGFSGGFVGVDIFFVISGYLITGIIAREIDGGRFSILRFYERRARRILPALTVVLAAVLLAAAVLYLPGDFQTVPRSALAAALFVCNIYFFSKVGYFQMGADIEPLLHSWSLGIEEQFYIGFPLLLLLIHRLAPGRRRAIVGAIAAGSLAWAIALQGDRSGFAFYLLPPRAWELFAGALLALGTVPPVRAPWAREAIALAGLAAIASAVFAYDSATSFPGAAALPPVLGAAALIHCAPGTAIGRLLGRGPLVGIGLVSYSLYLWHWPVIVFVQYALDRPLSGWLSAAAILVSLAAAILSWRFVERPFRDPRTIGRRAIFAASAGAMGSLCAASLAMAMLGGWPGRFAPEIGRMAAARDDVSPERARCHDTATTGQRPCTLGAPGVAPTALLWGDSHGVELSYALGRIAAREGRALIERTQSSCPPALDYASSAAPGCARVNRDVLAAIRTDRRLHTIYLAGFWMDPAYDRAWPGLDATIAELLADGRQVVLVGPVPPNRFDVPRRLARLALGGRLAEAEGRSRADLAEVEMRMRELAGRWRGRDLVYLDPADVLCDASRCALLAEGRPLYFDYHHLSLTGAERVLRDFARRATLPLG